MLNHLLMMMTMTQTNEVPIDQKQEPCQERAPHLRNIDLTVEEQLSDLEIRLEKQMRVNKNLRDQLERHENELRQHNHTWRSIFAHMQDSGLGIVTHDDLESEVSSVISYSSDVVSQDDLDEKVKDSIQELTFSVTVE